jgi:hypothetical protein
MIEERKTHYSDTKYCDRLGEEVLVEQKKDIGERIIIQCGYINLGRCDMDSLNPRSCLLNNKLVNVIRS